jgi:hypothetical protein
MLRTVKNHVPLIVMSFMLAGPRTALACSACVGRSDDAATQGLNAAVLTLLTVLLVVLGAAGGFLAYMVRRSVKHPLALPSMPGGVVQ